MSEDLFSVTPPEAPQQEAPTPAAETAMENAIVRNMNNLPATTTQGPIERMMAQEQQRLQDLNPDFRLDYVNPFTWLKVDKKGNFYYELSGEKFAFGDKIRVKLAVGEPVYQLWGVEGTEDAGTLLCWGRDHVTSVRGDICDECPFAGQTNPKTGESLKNDCKIRLALILNVMEEGEDPEEYFMLNVPTTGAFAFADYTKLLKKKKLGVRDVVTLIYTDEAKSRQDTSISYTAILFKQAT